MENINRVSLRHLRILTALLREGSLSRVGAQMGLTQQAVSANLLVLRDVFGDELFIRSGKGVIPTSLAQTLGVEAEDVLLRLDRMIDRAPFDASKTKATLNVSATDYSHAVVVAPRLRAIREQAPGLKLILSEIQIDAVGEKTLSGEIDIVVSIPQFLPREYPRTMLCKDHYVCVAAKGSPLTKKRQTLRTIAEQPHVIVSPTRANMVGAADVWLQEQGLSRDIIMSVPYFSLVPQVLEATGAVAFLPSRLLPDPLLSVVLIENDASPPAFETIAAWHHRANTNPVIHWLVSMLTNDT